MIFFLLLVFHTIYTIRCNRTFLSLDKEFLLLQEETRMEIVRNFQLFLKDYEAGKQEVFHFNYNHLLSDMIFFSYTLLYKLDCYGRSLNFLNIGARNHFKKAYPRYVYICICYQKIMRT